MFPTNLRIHLFVPLHEWIVAKYNNEKCILIEHYLLITLQLKHNNFKMIYFGQLFNTQPILYVLGAQNAKEQVSSFKALDF